jgi:hypothetical protein
MKVITASLLYQGMREKAGYKDVRISIRGVREAGPGQYTPATQSEIVPDNDRSLDWYAVPEFDLYMVDAVYDAPKHDPSLKMTRAEFLMDLLNRLDGFGQAVKYLPSVYERVAEELEIAGHYIRGAYDLAELADLSYLEKEKAVYE